MGSSDARRRPDEQGDGWDALTAANTRSDGLDAGASLVSLELAVVQCEQRYGAGWYYAPGRWPTDDGFVPFALVAHYWRAIGAEHALDALNTARGIALAFADGDQSEIARKRAVEQAYPVG